LGTVWPIADGRPMYQLVTPAAGVLQHFVAGLGQVEPYRLSVCGNW